MQLLKQLFPLIGNPVQFSLSRKKDSQAPPNFSLTGDQTKHESSPDQASSGPQTTEATQPQLRQDENNSSGKDTTEKESIHSENLARIRDMNRKQVKYAPPMSSISGI